ncbi:sensor histidine kinase [Micromonospora parathelypteridis]|uniref:histidine kinase n=1 Tax=Micromonospora parathelypteridis TaxID=1839617 RepID=A0A840W574_9ACTN|nr:sensor histidine kinase [Micromonospora parathelypteridis]MBB5481164.1 signal transduction histidine kinase [Micromonospora parathelypteridis]GGO19791.1 two-component sensor histidine kinase [Micromonospora parathelypteridis]
MTFEALRRWWATVPPWVGESALVVVVAVATVFRIRTGVLQPADRPPDQAAYLLGLAMSTVLALRRRWPALVLALVTVGWLAYHMLDYPGGAPAVPVWVALYSGAAATDRAASIPVAAILIGSDLQGRVATQNLDPLDPTLDGSFAVFIAALLLGEATRSRRHWQAETRARLALLTAERDRVAADRDRAAAERLARERIRIAQELHDITAHTIAVIGVQAGVAAETLRDSPEQARAALGAVRQASREAMRDLRAAVGVLRDGTPATADPPGDADPADTGLPEGVPLGATPAQPEPPAPSLDRLPVMAQACGAGDGPAVALTWRGDRRPLPQAVEATAYRIAQESLTNVLRHAAANRVDVTVEYLPDGLRLEIVDDGTQPATPGTGFGIRGMAERAGSLGGWLAAGSEPAGGFRVRAWLPVREATT